MGKVMQLQWYYVGSIIAVSLILLVLKKIASIVLSLSVGIGTDQRARLYRQLVVLL